MELEKYEFTTQEENKLFEFVSIGPKGSIIKRIKFVETNVPFVYALEFGDLNKNAASIDYVVASDNNDTMKVLATVAEVVRLFLDSYVADWIFARGSTQSRTRLYQIKINRFLSKISTDFEVYGRVDGEWKTFSTGYAYDAFLVCRRRDNFINKLNL